MRKQAVLKLCTYLSWYLVMGSSWWVNHCCECPGNENNFKKTLYSVTGLPQHDREKQGRKSACSPLSLKPKRKATLTDIKIKKKNLGNVLENNLTEIWRTMHSESILGKSHLIEF